MNIAIIGTAGRKEDGPKLNKQVYDTMYGNLLSDIWGYSIDTRHLVSGGAAWADHLAVRAFLDLHTASLELHFPAPWAGAKFVESGHMLCPGKTANYYHALMSRKLGISSLKEIQEAIDAGATYTVSNGFHLRNKLVGKADMLVAFTFGSHGGIFGNVDSKTAGLKDGGTAHTWDNSSASIKVHRCLNDIR